MLPIDILNIIANNLENRDYVYLRNSQMSCRKGQGMTLVAQFHISLSSLLILKVKPAAFCLGNWFEKGYS